MTQNPLLVFWDLLRQEDFKFKGSLGYISRLCLKKKKKNEGFRAAVNLVSYSHHLPGMTVRGVTRLSLIGFAACSTHRREFRAGHINLVKVP